MICLHCKRALEEAIDKIEKATEVKQEDWPTEEEEKRMDIIPRNGNDGLHYEVVEKWEDDFEQAEDEQCL